MFVFLKVSVLFIAVVVDETTGHAALDLSEDNRGFRKHTQLAILLLLPILHSHKFQFPSLFA